MPTSIINIKVKSGREAAFEAFVKDLVAIVNANEAGVRFYQAFGSGEPGQYCFVECFADDAALKAHLAADHFKARRPQLLEFFDGAPTMQRLTDI